MERGGQHEAKASHPRTGDPKARRRREAAQPGPRRGRGLPATRDHPVDLAPLEESIRRHEGQRRQAPQGAGEAEHPTQAHRGQPGPRHRHVEVRRRGKILTPNRRRRVVVALEEEFGVSERRACVVIGQNRSTQRLSAPSPSENEEKLRAFLRDFAKRHPRWGWRRGHDALRDAGWRVNHKKVQRLWRDEGLKVPYRKKKKKLSLIHI